MMTAQDDIFQYHDITNNGVKMQYLTAGQGEPLVFFHGAGLIGGWEFARPWAKHFQLYLPFHPGWGGSDDAPHMTCSQDFVDHHLAFVDAMGLDQFNLVGFSMGGWIASKFASQQAHRLKKFALVAPAGMRDVDHPSTDLFDVPPEDILSWLVHDMNCLAPFAPDDPEDTQFLAELYRENSSFARLGWARMWEQDLEKQFDRITMDTLLLWGEEDRIIPHGQAGKWLDLLPNARLHSLKGVGHLPFLEDVTSQDVVTTFFNT